MTAPVIEDPAVKALARGANPPWTGSFAHTSHGELTFTARLPKALALVEHSVRMDKLLGDLEVAPRGQTMIYVAALAGMTDSLLMEMPVVGERRVEDEERGSTKIEYVYYDPREEVDMTFLAEVWLDYSAWRAELLSPAKVEALGKSSEPTPGSGSSEDSSNVGGSPPTILDS